MGVRQKKARGVERQGAGAAVSAEQRREFLRALETELSVYRACRRAKVGRNTIYALRDRDEDFARAWKEAQEAAVEELEASAYERALGGDTTLTIFLLKGFKPERYRERYEHTGPEGSSLLGPAVTDAILRLVAGAGQGQDLGEPR
jgi:hypothetical protein